MTHEAAVTRAAGEALRFGAGSGGARLTSGASFEISDLEAELARFKGKEAALVFNTGYMTNLGVIWALAGKEDVIFSDSLNHASIIDGCRMSGAKIAVYPHSDTAALERLLAETPCAGQRYIVTDGVFSMDGDIARLPELAVLRDKYGAALLVDDAHATGVIGKTGRGTAEYWGLEGAVDIQVGTLSKALGAEGGFVCASEDIIRWLRNRSRPFIFSTAIGPSTAAAALASLRLLEAEPQRLEILRANTARLRDALTAAGLPLLPGIRRSCPSCAAKKTGRRPSPGHAGKKGSFSPPSVRRPYRGGRAVSGSPSPRRTRRKTSTGRRPSSSGGGARCEAPDDHGNGAPRGAALCGGPLPAASPAGSANFSSPPACRGDLRGLRIPYLSGGGPCGFPSRPPHRHGDDPPCDHRRDLPPRRGAHGLSSARGGSISLPPGPAGRSRRGPSLPP